MSATWLNVALFAACAAVVWFAGTRITRYAVVIARRTGIGYAATGVLLLAVVTSLPEAAVTASASAAGNAGLALNNLLGSVALHLAILAVADAVYGKDALTSVIADPVVLLQAALNVLLLALFTAAAVLGDLALPGVGAWSVVLLVAYVVAVWFIERSRDLHSWIAAKAPLGREAPIGEGEPAEAALRPVLLKTVAAGAAILTAGTLLSKSGEAIAEQTGLGQSFAGFVLLAVATSLPEMSTMFAAVRMRRYLMAVSETFGSNLFTIGLVFLADASYQDGPILDQADAFTAFAAVLGIAVTALFLIGLIERRDRTVGRMGIDSLAVLCTYFAGLALLYQLR
jgi:cation:H+ antiporter